MASSKRQAHPDDRHRDGQAPGDESKRRQGDSRREIRSSTIPEFVEPFFRKLVREEVQTALQRLLGPRGPRLNQTGTSGGRGRALQLCFMKGPPREIYTGTKVVAEDGTPLQIALCDARSQYSIVRDGPLSSMMIELCVLNGGFGSKGSEEDWTADEFSASVLRETREGGQLLWGNKFIRLTNGVGCITQVYVNDISRWARTGKFRFGAKIVEPTPGGEDIREGRSETFTVKDNRGEAYKKHDVPSLKDEVWRLKKIAKDGKRHKQLSKHGIETVQDLLLLHQANPDLLKKIIGNTGRKTWATLIQHANACAVQADGNCHMYHTAQQPNAYAGQPYLPTGSLDSEHRGYCGNLQAEQGLQPLQFPIASTSASHNDQLSINGVPGLGEFPEWMHSDESLWSLLNSVTGDGAECSNRSSSTNSAVYTSNKGTGTTVWDDIRNAVKLLILRVTKGKTKLAPWNC